MTINIAVRNKIAELQGEPRIVCGNSDYIVHFDFDAEWDAYPRKTAIFRYCVNNKTVHHEVQFDGDTVAVPVLHNVLQIEVGVFAGDIRTTTPVTVKCKRCSTDGDCAIHAPPPEDVYNQVMESLSALHRRIDELEQTGGIGNGVLLVTAPTSGETELSVVISGKEYDAANMIIN